MRKNKVTTKCKKRTVTCDARTAQCENKTVKCKKKKNKCDKRIVKCDIGIAQCEDGIVKCDVLVTWYSRLLTSEYCTKKKKRRNTVELSLMYICMCLSVNCPGVSQVVISPHNG